MKTAIVHGNKYTLGEDDREFLDQLLLSEAITLVVLRAGPRDDPGVKSWAEASGLHVLAMPGNRFAHGRLAGQVRDDNMLDFVDAVVVFSRGRNVDDICRAADKKGVVVYDRRRAG